jgi:hypothetical protein
MRNLGMCEGLTLKNKGGLILQKEKNDRTECLNLNSLEIYIF